MKIKPLPKTKDICLVQMPLARRSLPAFSLSLFKALFNERNISSIVIYNDLKFSEKVGVEYYSSLERTLANHLMGEFLFSKAVGWKTAKDAGGYFERLRDTYSCKYPKALSQFDALCQKSAEMQETATEFIAEAVDEVLSFQPKIVGCASMFQQNLASLAFLRQVKEREPGIITLIGGANCMGAAAIGMAESMPWLDYVFSGEADDIIADFCAALLADGRDLPEESLPYGVVRKGLRLKEKNPYRISENIDNLPTPDYSDYFAALEHSSLKESIIPGLHIEGSRGCWWGEKKPCSFCGLGGLSQKYRQKSTAKVLSEIKELSAKHGVKRFTFTDSIMSMKHIEELLPELKKLNASEKDKYAFFSETKTNLTENQIKNLKEAGFSWIQPGIESIQDDFLKAMNKGNRAIKHIEFLKYCRTYCIIPAWNMLIGFPQEKQEWIDELTAIVPFITHLPPPAYQANRISYHNHSVYVTNSQEYGLCLRPVETYDYLYPDEGVFAGLAEKIAYLFEPVDKKERDEYYEIFPLAQYADLYKQVSGWNEKYHIKGDTMTMQVYDDKIEILDLRVVAQKSLLTLTGLEKEIYTAAENAISKKDLCLKLESRFDLSQIEQAIEKLCEDKLMLCINSEVLALACKKAEYYYASGKDYPLGNI